MYRDFGTTFVLNLFDEFLLSEESELIDNGLEDEAIFYEIKRLNIPIECAPFISNSSKYTQAAPLCHIASNFFSESNIELALRISNKKEAIIFCKEAFATIVTAYGEQPSRLKYIKIIFKRTLETTLRYLELPLFNSTPIVSRYKECNNYIVNYKEEISMGFFLKQVIFIALIHIIKLVIIQISASSIKRYKTVDLRGDKPGNVEDLFAASRVTSIGEKLFKAKPSEIEEEINTFIMSSVLEAEAFDGDLKGSICDSMKDSYELTEVLKRSFDTKNIDRSFNSITEESYDSDESLSDVKERVFDTVDSVFSILIEAEYELKNALKKYFNIELPK